MLGDLPVKLSLGGHKPTDVDGADVVFVTPGAPREMEVLAIAQERGIPISSEIELLFQRCKAGIVGITGSAGKSTTTTLVGDILRADGRSVHVGGNIGRPLIEHVDEFRPGDWVVLELSSFQLESLAQSPPIGAILNVTPKSPRSTPDVRALPEKQVQSPALPAERRLGRSRGRRSGSGGIGRAVPRPGAMVCCVARGGA